MESATAATPKPCPRPLGQLDRDEMKLVVFTGAMLPLANGNHSDGFQNLEYIFQNMDRWQPGVRVVMHGKSYNPQGLRKNFDTYQFHGQELRDSALVMRS